MEVLNIRASLLSRRPHNSYSVFLLFLILDSSEKMRVRKYAHFVYVKIKLKVANKLDQMTYCQPCQMYWHQQCFFVETKLICSRKLDTLALRIMDAPSQTVSDSTFPSLYWSSFFYVADSFRRILKHWVL